MLKPSEMAYLDAIRSGQTAAEYAVSLGFTPHWAKYKSKRIRAKLGVATIREALRVSEQTTGLTAEERAELERLKRELREAREDLREARTPRQRSEAREDVRDAEAELDRHARALGLTREEVEAIQKEKRYKEYQEHASRYEQEKAAAEEEAKKKPPARKPAAKADDDDGEDEKPPESSHWSERKLFGGKT